MNCQRSKILFSPLRHRDFRLFWIGSLLSSIGSQFTTVAMAWHIYELTNSSLQIGMIGLVRAVPQMAILLFGGLLADAINRRTLMMMTQASLFVVSSTLALLTLGAQMTPLKLYVVAVFLALFSSLEAPSRYAIVTNLVPAQTCRGRWPFPARKDKSLPSPVRPSPESYWRWRGRAFATPWTRSRGWPCSVRWR